MGCPSLSGSATSAHPGVVGRASQRIGSTGCRGAGYGQRVCFYATHVYKLHFVCVDCRVSFKHYRWPIRVHSCPRCRKPLTCAGHDFAAPRRNDVKRWSVVRAILAEGLRFDERDGCGCSREPKFRPRSRAQLRERQIASKRLEVPLAVMLARRDPQQPETRDEKV